MKFPFYSNYTIDDSNIGCHRVIYADCDGVHKYKSVCELMQECAIDPQLKKQCIVDFLNSNLKSKAGQYLKIDNKGCLTTGTPECPCDDKKVGATLNDPNPGPLIDKLIGGCDATGTYCITVGTPNPGTVQVLPSGPRNGFTQFKGTADCDDAYVKMDRNGNVFTECPEILKAPRYAFCKHQGGSVTTPWNTTPRIVTPANGSSRQQYNFSGGRDILATEGFERDTEDGVILIQEPGLYYFAYSIYFFWEPSHVHAIRAGLRVNNVEICDFKYNGMGYYQDTPMKGSGYEYFYPKTDVPNYGSLALDMSGLSFTGSYIYPITNASVSNPARLKLTLKPDSRTFDKKLIQENADITFHIPDGSRPEFGPPGVITIAKIKDEDIFNRMRNI